MSMVLWMMLTIMTIIGYFCNHGIGNNALIGNFLVSVMLILAWGYCIVVGAKKKHLYGITLGYSLLIFIAVLIQLLLYFSNRDGLLWNVCGFFITPFQGIQYIAGSALLFYVWVGLAALAGIAGSVYKLQRKRWRGQ